MGRRLSFSTTTVVVAIGVIVVSTAILSYFSYYYTVGRENLVETSLVQTNIKLASQFVDRIEQKIIDNDRLLAGAIDVDEPARWPSLALEVKNGDFNVEQVYVLRTDSSYPLYPPYSNEIRDDWGAFRQSFRLNELNLGQLVPNQVHHLHKERSDNYFFASYVLKENRQGEKFIVCFQMNFEKILATVDRYLRDLQPNFYVSIVDFDNNGVYNQPISRSSRYFYETRFPTTLYKWLLQMVPRNYTEIEQDAKNQRRIYLFLIILSMLLILCSLAIIYAASVRERQLAQLKEDFIGQVSHELKTPLSLISMFSEILLTGRAKSDSSRQEYYGIIHTESERMNRLVNNLLDFARLERDRHPLQLEPVNIAELVDKELDGYRHQIQRDGFQINKEIESGIPETLADPNAIMTAFLNLLDNSVKYSGDNKEITIRVGRSNGFIDLSIVDHGPGIPLEEQQKIFEKFYRGSNVTGLGIRGSGMGLSITKRVADMHGGEVRLESSPGKGSTFTLRIPIRGASHSA